MSSFSPPQKNLSFLMRIVLSSIWSDWQDWSGWGKGSPALRRCFLLVMFTGVLGSWWGQAFSWETCTSHKNSVRSQNHFIKKQIYVSLCFPLHSYCLCLLLFYYFDQSHQILSPIIQFKIYSGNQLLDWLIWSSLWHLCFLPLSYILWFPSLNFLWAHSFF